MNWSELFQQHQQPDWNAFSAFVHNPVWESFHSKLQQSYQVTPAFSFSKCAAQPGWNVKYQKSGRSLCTLYPMNGFFIALVVIGNREKSASDLLMPSFSSSLQELYQNTPFSCGGQWLMIAVHDEKSVDEVLQLINLRTKPKAK